MSPDPIAVKVFLPQMPPREYRIGKNAANPMDDSASIVAKVKYPMPAEAVVVFEDGREVRFAGCGLVMEHKAKEKWPDPDPCPQCGGKVVWLRAKPEMQDTWQCEQCKWTTTSEEALARYEQARSQLKGQEPNSQ